MKYMSDCGQHCSVSAADSPVNRHHTLNHLRNRERPPAAPSHPVPSAAPPHMW